MKARTSPSKSSTVLLLCFTTVQQIDRAASVFEVRQVPPRLPKKSDSDDRDVSTVRRFDPVPVQGDFQFHDAENNVHVPSENPSQLPSLAPSFIPSESSPSSSSSTQPEPGDLCVSIVAVAGTPDLDYFHNGDEEKNFDDEFISKDSNNFHNSYTKAFFEMQQQKQNSTNFQHYNLRQSQRQRQLHRKRQHSVTGSTSSGRTQQYNLFREGRFCV